MFRASRCCFHFSQLDASLKSFLKKYKTTPQLKPSAKHTLIEDNQLPPQPKINQGRQQQADPLKDKYLLSKAKKIGLEEKDSFSHFNRPQQLAINKINEQLSATYKASEKYHRAKIQGEEFIDQLEFSEEFSSRATQEVSQGILEVDKAVLKHIHGYNSEDFEMYPTVEEWRKFNKFKPLNLQRIKLEHLKRYPGSDKGPHPADDPEGFNDWFRDNHSPQVVEEMEELVAMYRDKAKGAGKNQRRKKNQKEESDDEELDEIAAGEESRSALMNLSTAVFARESIAEGLINGDPIDDLSMAGNVTIRSPLDPGEMEPVPEQVPLDYEEFLYFMERWSLYKMIPDLKSLKHMMETGEGMESNEPVRPGSLLPYYQTLPKAVRDDPNVKNVYRGLEWHNPELTLEDKELGLNLAARLSQPFNEISERILDMMADVRKVYPTKWDEDYLINDPENAVVDPALDTEATQKYADMRSTIKEGQKGDWQIPEWTAKLREREDDLPVDYYQNEDGFWDDYIRKKEQTYLDNKPLGGRKVYYHHK